MGKRWISVRNRFLMNEFGNGGWPLRSSPTERSEVDSRWGEFAFTRAAYAIVTHASSRFHRARDRAQLRKIRGIDTSLGAWITLLNFAQRKRFSSSGGVRARVNDRRAINHAATMTHRHDGFVGTFSSPSSIPPSRPPALLDLAVMFSLLCHLRSCHVTKCRRTELHCESFVRLVVRKETFEWNVRWIVDIPEEWMSLRVKVLKVRTNWHLIQVRYLGSNLKLNAIF